MSSTAGPELTLLEEVLYYHDLVSLFDRLLLEDLLTGSVTKPQLVHLVQKACERTESVNGTASSAASSGKGLLSNLADTVASATAVAVEEPPKVTGLGVGLGDVDRLLQRILSQLQLCSGEEEQKEDQSTSAEGSAPAPTAGTELGDGLVLDTFFASEFHLVARHEYLSEEGKMKQQLASFFQQYDLTFDSVLPPYQLVLVLQDLAPQVSHATRQRLFNTLVGPSMSGVQLGRCVMEEWAHLHRARVDYETRQTALRAPPPPADGVISIGSSSLLYDGEARLKTTAPVLIRPLKLDSEASEGHRLLLLAEDALVRNQIGETWSDAVALYERAATAAQETRHSYIAATAFVRAADCRAFIDDGDSQAAYLAEAGKHFRSTGQHLSEAAECYRMAAEIVVKHRPSFQAKHLVSLGNVLVDDERLSDAITAFTDSAHIYRRLNLVCDAKYALRRAVDVAITRIGDIALTIDLLEELSEVEDANQKPLILFYATVCHLATLPPEYGPDFSDSYQEAKNAFDEYTDVCPLLVRSSEGETIRRLFDAVLATSCDLIEQEVAKYLTGHVVPEWVERMMTVIHSNSIEKINRVDKLYKIAAPALSQGQDAASLNATLVEATGSRTQTPSTPGFESSSQHQPCESR